MRLHESVEFLGELDIIGKHLDIACSPHLAQSQPDLQSPEAPRVLRSVFMVIEGGRLLSEVVIGRMEAERLTQRFRIAHQGAAGL